MPKYKIEVYHRVAFNVVIDANSTEQAEQRVQDIIDEWRGCDCVEQFNGYSPRVYYTADDIVEVERIND